MEKTFVKLEETLKGIRTTPEVESEMKTKTYTLELQSYKHDISCEACYCVCCLN